MLFGGWLGSGARTKSKGWCRLTKHADQSTLETEHLVELASHVDDEHVKGCSVTRNTLINWAKEKCHREVSKRTMSRHEVLHSHVS
jgi:hypothetical protein